MSFKRTIKLNNYTGYSVNTSEKANLKSTFGLLLVPFQHDSLYICENRSSRPEVFCRKDVLRNFAKFTVKHLYQSLVFAGLGLQLY